MNASAVLTRPDYEVIAGWIKSGERVLDLGCGDGSLIRYLGETRQVRGVGVEIDPHNVLASIVNGINVIQIDLEAGLAGFGDGSFDHVVMSQSLQVVHHTEQILHEMLRVGREAVVSFPNFGYYRHREAIAAGRMPVSESLPYQWYDSPNVRFFTMADFEDLCAARGIEITERRGFDGGRQVADDPNLNASIAVYRLARAAR